MNAENLYDAADENYRSQSCSRQQGSYGCQLADLYAEPNLSSANLL